ncbi:Metal-dependent hydrolase, endonuclease/exonuclease/phosphatase family [Laceyella tengchongensis]|uniref:Metal-dependent hydrolase, endonuclease/exonuclease/phosphatase family n=1 Tax=Laceyella tengchongensis TaxID=574699 RepID=A0AA46ADJ1_9BACL|nr:endonuclease/exonuclease/phosphatase family protein [Laceyella tengchongensis]SMP06130.1 Metal-dependent hydrolase, endonuclease/exonuclease/phosphatase family [Laceyella tengchongensis]
MVKKALWGLALFCSLVLLCFGAFLLYVTLTDYEPEPALPLTVINNASQKLTTGVPFTVTTFNIGYAGLDKDQDFFMDGGTRSRAASKEQTAKNLSKILSFLKREASSFYLLQEVDVDSSRSYHINQQAAMRQHLPDYGLVFAQNYLVSWVPVPVFDPMGSVNGGLVTLSKYQLKQSTRFSLYGKEDWPQQPFDLDRCIMENRIPLENGKELILVNLHLSAFDKGGKVRKQQLAFLKEFMQRHVQAGNYLILGGDWNHLIPGTAPKRFKAKESWPEWMQTIPSDFLPKGFTWVADGSVPTSRTLALPFKQGINFQSNIDGFLISSNVEVKRVYGHSLQFEYSDHNPVTAEFVLK